MNQKVAIIILNWNNYADTIECVRSVQQSRYANYEIVLVDNFSSNDSVEILTREFPDIKLLQSEKNLGYAGGNNLGIVDALKQGAKLIWVLNPDTKVKEDTLEKLIRASQEENVGITIPKIYYYDDPQKVWFVDGKLDVRFGRADHLDYGKVDRGQFDRKVDLEWGPGTSMLIKREVVEKIGRFDEKYFLFYEDVDLCLRTRRAGYKVRLVPGAQIQHKVGTTVGRGNPNNEFYKTRNRLYFVKKFNPCWWTSVLTLMMFFKLCWRTVKTLLKRQDRQRLQAQWDGLGAFLKGNYGIRK